MANVVNQHTFNSMQTFGMNRFDRSHGILGSYNMGIAYPLGAYDVPAGSTLSNRLNIYAKSSALSDPAFLDCDISIGHYFVSYEAIDHFYSLRAQTFKGMSTNVPLPCFRVKAVAGSDPEESISSVLNSFFGEGTLFDHLGLSVVKETGDHDSFTSRNLPLYPLFAYHMIMDRFFRNSKVQDVERWRKVFLDLFPRMSDVLLSLDVSYNKDEGLQFLSDPSAGTFVDNSVYREFFSLEYVNFEPDYFTTARPTANGPVVSIPTGDKATIPNLLDAMLMQKVADMLERGGYSYNDFLRVIYGETPNDDEATYPIFLGGATAPLQVSTVVNTALTDDTAANALGTEAGTVSSYLNGDQGFTRTFHRSGIYMPLMWIRPKTYYSSGITPIWRQTTLGDSLIPQLADLQDAPIGVEELQAAPFYLRNEIGPYTSVFGYKDRYQEYRTTPNRVVGEMRTSRSSWFINRQLVSSSISDVFLSQMYLMYNPWVYTKSDEDHFFCRIWNNFENTVPLPATSAPYAF